MRDTPAVAHDVDGCAQTFESELTVERRQRAAQQVPECARGYRARRASSDAQGVQSEWHLTVFASWRVGLVAHSRPPLRARRLHSPSEFSGSWRRSCFRNSSSSVTTAWGLG